METPVMTPKYKESLAKLATIKGAIKQFTREGRIEDAIFAARAADIQESLIGFRNDLIDCHYDPSRGDESGIFIGRHRQITHQLSKLVFDNVLLFSKLFNISLEDANTFAATYVSVL